MCLNTPRYASVTVDYVLEDDHNLPSYGSFHSEVLPLSDKDTSLIFLLLESMLACEVFGPKICEESGAA